MFRRYVGEDPQRERFVVCQGYGCSDRMETGLSAGEWEQIEALFSPPAASAEEERERIERAIALFERIVGPKTGSDIDKAGATVISSNHTGQMDCLDETVNTSTYLTFLEAAGLLRHHYKDKALRRGYLIDGLWTHNTATVTERATGARYTVDSWFRKNGEPPVIIPVKEWLDGYFPPDYKR